MNGRRLSAEEAYRMGMINRLVPRERLEAETTELAEKAAAAYPFAVKLLKRSLKRVAHGQGFRTSIQSHFDTHQLSHVTEEYRRMRDQGIASGIARGGCLAAISERGEAFRCNAGWRQGRQPLVRDQSCDLRRETGCIVSPACMKHHPESRSRTHSSTVLCPPPADSQPSKELS